MDHEEVGRLFTVRYGRTIILRYVHCIDDNYRAFIESNPDDIVVPEQELISFVHGIIQNYDKELMANGHSNGILG